MVKGESGCEAKLASSNEYPLDLCTTPLQIPFIKTLQTEHREVPLVPLVSGMQGANCTGQVPERLTHKGIMEHMVVASVLGLVLLRVEEPGGSRQKHMAKKSGESERRKPQKKLSLRHLVATHCVMRL